MNNFEFTKKALQEQIKAKEKSLKNMYDSAAFGGWIVSKNIEDSIFNIECEINELKRKLEVINEISKED